ncbi:DegV family protein [Paenibacillus thermotolerans]|uniref:DegV family protein n=1 Tax=Paenibacillus thermotolerans TaxID=3027807 RepID=UPI0023686E20|nr:MULTISPECIES: DegV family protein [unclassified Paenibacillus]
MANVRIVVDSTADIPLDIRQRLGIEMVPLKVHFGNETYLDSVTIHADQFFEKLAAAKEMPTTSQPSPVDFLEKYKKLLEEPDTAIISIHLSSAFSGTYQSAVLAKSLLGTESNIHIVDSKTASLGVGILAMAAAEAAQSGASAEQILQLIETTKQQTRLYFLVDTLEYLHKNGRIGKASAVFGSLLNIKPILSIDDEGTIYPVDRVRGSRKAMNRIVELLKNDFNGKEVDISIVHAVAEQPSKELEQVIREHFNVRTASFYELGPVIGTHVGPGTLGLFMTPAKA